MSKVLATKQPRRTRLPHAGNLLLLHKRRHQLVEAGQLGVIDAGGRQLAWPGLLSLKRCAGSQQDHPDSFKHAFKENPTRAVEHGKPSVLSVRTKPEPNNILAVTKGDGPVPKADARREDWPRRMYSLELKVGMEGVPLEEAGCVSGTPLTALR